MIELPVKPLTINPDQPTLGQRAVKWVNDRIARFCHKALSHCRCRMGNLRQHSPGPISPEPRLIDESVANLPTISIVTPTFNQGRYIERTIRSVMTQGYPHLDYAIRDGGSSDETHEVVARLAGEYSFKWKAEKDRGQADAINKGFEMVDGEIMGWLNSDDLLMPGTLHDVGAYFATHPEVDVLYGHRILIDENDGEIGRWVTPPYRDEALIFFDYVPQETLFWRRRTWEKIGGNVDVDFHFAIDWDLLLRFRDSGARIVRIPRFLGCFRIHDEQKTSARMVDVGTAEMLKLRPDVAADPALRLQMTRLYYSEQFRSQLTSLLLQIGYRSESI